MAQRLEESRNHECGGDDGYVVCLIDEAAQEVLESNDQAEIYQSQRGGERPVDQRAIDEHVDVPQPSAQHGEPKRERDQEQ